MSRHRFRRQRDFKGVEKEIHKSEIFDSAVAAKVEDYKQYVQDEQKGALAEYVLKRKSVLDLLDVFLGFKDKESERHHLEAAVHSLICPMRTDSASLEISEHNLWIADDRLAFSASLPRTNLFGPIRTTARCSGQIWHSSMTRASRGVNQRIIRTRLCSSNSKDQVAKCTATKIH